jgi:hypothetical protein
MDTGIEIDLKIDHSNWDGGRIFNKNDKKFYFLIRLLI